MLLNLSETESFVNKVASSHTSVPLSVRLSEDVIMPQYKDDQISISNYSMVLMLLESCSILNRKLFNKVLFFYYWASKNLILGELQNFIWCTNAFINEVNKKQRRLHGMGTKVHCNLYYNFVFGHEAIHHSFAHNDVYKKGVMNEIVEYINEAYEGAFLDREWFKNAIQQPLKDFNQQKERKIPVEECACDRESIKYIHKTFIECANLSKEEYVGLLDQLFLMISMIHYEGIMNNLSRYQKLSPFDLVKGSMNFNRYINEHIEKEIFRLGCIAFTLHEISIYPDYNPTFVLNKIIKDNHKMMSRLLSIGLSNIAHSVNGTSSNMDKRELDKDMHNTMNEINNHIFSLLLND